MVKKNSKVDTSSARTPLTDSPFGALAGLRGEVPAVPVEKKAPKAEILDDSAAAFRVAKTRKGGWPVSFERRSAGKLVTVVGRVTGDGNALLKLLRKHCATGGVFKEGAVELQGDHRDKVSAWLDRHAT